MHHFRLDTHIRMGLSALDALDEYRQRPCFLITDEFLATTPTFAKVRAKLPHAVVFDQVMPDPTIKLISQGLAQYLGAKPDVVVAYGGGSVIDAAKAMHKAAVEAGAGAELGLIAVPTTSGSGSEVTAYAVLTDEVTHAKIPLISSDMVARLAILDPEAASSQPPKVTADSGMDVLTHAIEAHVSLNACDFSDAFAEKAVQLVLGNLARCYRHGDDMVARGHMHNASSMAAMAFDNVGLGITHSLAHALGGRYSVAHGRLNAILLPHVIVFNAERSERASERYARLGGLVSPSATGRAAVTTLVSSVRRLLLQLNIPARLTEVGIERARLMSDLESLATTALHDRCTATNPTTPHVDDLSALLREAA